jgi:flagellar motor component MotA
MPPGFVFVYDNLHFDRYYFLLRRKIIVIFLGCKNVLILAFRCKFFKEIRKVLKKTFIVHREPIQYTLQKLMYY